MLGLAEYRAWVAQLQRVGQQYDDHLVETLKDVKNKQEAIKLARAAGSLYVNDYERLLRRSLHEIAFTAANHYVEHLGLEDNPADLAAAMVEKQFQERYYGATLNQRLGVQQKRLTRNITQRGNVAIERIPGVFASNLPGSQFNVDRRLLQGTAVKVERDTAQVAAELGDIPLIRWTLAAQHARTCMCDQYANQVDNEVVAYLKEKSINENPRGLYFREHLPEPPHPNCQCEFGMVSAQKRAQNPLRRALASVAKLINRLRGK